MDNDSGAVKFLILGLVIGLFLGGALGYLYTSLRSPDKTQVAPDGGFVSAEYVKAAAEGFINENLLQPSISAAVENVTLQDGMYKIDVAIDTAQGEQRALLYASAGGNLLFINPPINMSEPLPKSDIPTQAPAEESNVDMKTLVDDDPWAGSLDAKVIIVEFSDFQCPFCAKALPTVRQIKETYGDSILFVYRDFPLSSIHPEAQKAAEAAQCAYEQDRFWDYHDTLFEKQSEWSGVGTQVFKKFAADLGLNEEVFNECLDGGRYADEVADDLKEGQHFGVTGTPTFFVAGKRLVGAQPFSAFKAIIDQELA